MNFCSNLMKWLWKKQFPIFSICSPYFAPLKASPIFIRFWRKKILMFCTFTSSKWGALLAAAVLRSQRKGAYLRGIASNPRALSTRGCWSHHRSGVFFGRSCGVVGGWGGLIISSWVQGGSVGLETKECHRSRILSLKKFFLCQNFQSWKRISLVVYVESQRWLSQDTRYKWWHSMWFLDIQQWHTFWGKILDWMDAKENAVGGSRMTNTASFCCDQRLRLLLFGDFQGVRYWSIWFSFSFCLQKFSTSQKEDKPSTSCLLPVPKLQILQPYQFLLFFRLGNETILQFRFIPSFPTDFRLVFLDLFFFIPCRSITPCHDPRIPWVRPRCLKLDSKNTDLCRVVW